MLTFLPFPDWFGLVGLITSATVIMYAMAPLALAGLRKKDPDRPRGYRLPAAWLLSPLAFVCANIVVYVSGYSTIFWLEMFIAVGFIIFGLYQLSRPAADRLARSGRPSRSDIGCEGHRSPGARRRACGGRARSAPAPPAAA